MYMYKCLNTAYNIINSSDLRTKNSYNIACIVRTHVDVFTKKKIIIISLII